MSCYFNLSLNNKLSQTPLNFMKTTIYSLLIIVLLTGCKQNESVPKETSKKEVETIMDSTAVQKDTVVTSLEKDINVKDTIPVHIFKSGETLWNLCRTYYGNRHYSSILARYNEIENVNNIKDSTPIKIPELENLFKDPKLKLAPIENELDKMLAARTLFMKHQKTLGDLREEVEGRTPITLPETVKNDLQQAISLLNETISSLKQIESDSIETPKRTVSQLNSVVNNLTNLAKGNHDGPYKYDLDMFHQNLIRALNNSITWAQNKYKN